MEKIGMVQRVAGRALDMLIAEKVMGMPICDQPSASNAPCSHRGIANHFAPDDPNMPEYSMDISAAFQVVEKMRELGFYLDIHDIRHGCYREEDGMGGGWLFGYWVEVSSHKDGEPFPTDLNIHAWGETAALAICNAALKAVEAISHV